MFKLLSKSINLLNLIKIFLFDHFHFVIQRKRERLARDFIAMHGNIVRYGPLRGTVLYGAAGRGLTDKPSMICGFYEKEVLDLLTEKRIEGRTLINVGAADGYYSVGLIKTGFFDSAICFEMSEHWQRVIHSMATSNQVRDKLTIFGKAELNFIDQLEKNNIDLSTSTFLIDIEGAEFDILNLPNLARLSKSLVIVENHWFLREDGDAQLDIFKRNASQFFEIREVHTGARDLSVYPEVSMLADDVRWLLCSEGRSRLASWLILEPRGL